MHFRQMAEINLIKPDTLKDLLFKKFEDCPPVGEDVDPLSSGEFEVIKQLVTAIPEAGRAKEHSPGEGRAGIDPDSPRPHHRRKAAPLRVNGTAIWLKSAPS